MAIDYYAEANNVIEALEHDGLVDEGSRLREMMQAGSTGTEILMGLRWHLQRILAEKVPTSAATDGKIRILIAELSRTLS